MDNKLFLNLPNEDGTIEKIEIVNEDGTSMDNFPENPLKEKWDKLYSQSQTCVGYSCMWCGRCPNGVNWKVPDEDKEVWDEYLRQIKEYHKTHNPKLTERIEEALNVLKEEDLK